DWGAALVVAVAPDRQHVGRGAVAAQQHEVVEILVLPDHAALYLVLDHGLAGLRRLQADGRLDAGRRRGRIAIAPQAVIEAGGAPRPPPPPPRRAPPLRGACLAGPRPRPPA